MLHCAYGSAGKISLQQQQCSSNAAVMQRGTSCCQKVLLCWQVLQCAAVAVAARVQGYPGWEPGCRTLLINTLLARVLGATALELQGAPRNAAGIRK